MRIFPTKFHGMAEMRGRPFAFVALTLGSWIWVRMALVPNAENGTIPPAMAPVPDKRVADVPMPIADANFGAVPVGFQSNRRAAPLHHRRAFISSFRPPPAKHIWQIGGWPSGSSDVALVAAAVEPKSSGRDTPPTNALALVGKASQPKTSGKWAADIYAYSFWRLSTGSNTAFAPGAQYGGSQSGVILTIDPFGNPKHGAAVLARAAITPNGREKELALGLRWKPASHIPVSLTAERRLQINGLDRFAAYLAGGFDPTPVIGSVKADGFAQAGFVSGKDGGGFFDAQAKLTHPLTHIGNAPITIGAGSWAGGQQGAVRIDVGPSIATKVDIGPSDLLIQLDWRKRIAGNARPKNGLALTLSSGF
jgi:hypothetical protein